ncbi:cAMP-independent regulatory protein pac2 [Rhizoctonia solani]|uniref:cAMP-independent regulatory protein pac2 n=1 Tax=Rhizoctonia solani TaxID=456999 RepID=A0A8H8P1R9_9AGAM|nr:cAMP-independent regulatory protein pac2 [Rhizoctonia solani]QRW22785.1 cAMP-independent regulatory protein pac2 [Rhizoctonia solani]
MSPSSTNSPPSRSEPVWTEPPCSWFIETTEDALLILEAARRGLIPRVTRRLVDRERRMITSGSVFVFDEDESGIKRWTDGLLWSPSRILGNFLLYRETDKKGTALTPMPNLHLMKDSTTSLSRPKDGRAQADRNRERALVGSLTNSYKFKPDGMMKKTFSLTVNGSTQHLISYYKVADVEEGRLRTPSSLPELSVLDISPEYLDKTHFRCPPKVEIDADGIPRYRGEADDPDSPLPNHIRTLPTLLHPGTTHTKTPTRTLVRAHPAALPDGTNPMEEAEARRLARRGAQGDREVAAEPTHHPRVGTAPRALLARRVLDSPTIAPRIRLLSAHHIPPPLNTKATQATMHLARMHPLRPADTTRARLPSPNIRFQWYQQEGSYTSQPVPPPAPTSSYYAAEDGYHSSSSYGGYATSTPAPATGYSSTEWIGRRDSHVAYAPAHAHTGAWSTEVHGS